MAWFEWVKPSVSTHHVDHDDGQQSESGLYPRPVWLENETRNPQATPSVGHTVLRWERLLKPYSAADVASSLNAAVQNIAFKDRINLVKQWLWMTSGSNSSVADTYNQHFKASKGSISDMSSLGGYMENYDTKIVGWTKAIHPIRKEGWSPWGDGFSSDHYVGSNGLLYNILRDPTSSWKDGTVDLYMSMLRHKLQFGMHWLSYWEANTAYEKGYSFNGDTNPPSRPHLSHFWVEDILMAAYIEDDKESPLFDAVKALRYSIDYMSNRDVGTKFGVRDEAWLLRAIRCYMTFFPELLPEGLNQGTKICKQMLDLVDSDVDGWSNNVNFEIWREVWQEWLMLSEIMHWSAFTGVSQYAVRASNHAETLIEDGLYQDGKIAYRSRVLPDGSYAGEFVNPALDTYVIPVAYAMEKLGGLEHWKKIRFNAIKNASEYPLHEEGFGRGIYGGSTEKQLKRSMYGLTQQFTGV